MNIEEVDSSETNDNDMEISNEGCTTIANEQRSFKSLDEPMMLNCDEGKTAIAGENMMHCKIN